MNPVHQRPFTTADLSIYRTMGESLAIGGMSQVRLDKGRAHAQKFRNRCAAAAVWNALETCDDQWKGGLDFLCTPQEIYVLARSIDEFPEHAIGTSLHAAAEAACRIVGQGIRWMELPCEAQVLAAWIATERTGIAYGTQWTAGHATPRKNVLLPTPEQLAPGHAVHLHGFDANFSWRPRWWQAKRRMPVFVVENSHTHPELDFYLPASGVPVHGLAAIVFVPSTY